MHTPTSHNLLNMDWQTTWAFKILSLSSDNKYVQSSVSKIISFEWVLRSRKAKGLIKQLDFYTIIPSIPPLLLLYIKRLLDHETFVRNIPLN